VNWNELYPKATMPEMAQINEYVQIPFWRELCGWLENRYTVAPRIEHSTCACAPGWNVKYRKSSRALCTLYPHDGYFVCMVSIGAAEAPQAELLLPTCTQQVRELYQQVTPLCGARWLMIEVRSQDTLRDVQRLIDLRVKPAKPRKPQNGKE